MFITGYTCGVLCADGWIALDTKHGNYVISLETKEREFALRFRFSLSHCAQKESRIYETKNKRYKELPYKTFIVSLYGKRIVKDFKNKWGIRTGSYSWKVPGIAFIDGGFRRGFLRGYFDGEGHVRLRLKKTRGGWRGKRRLIRVTSANLSGLKQVKKLLEMEGIRSIIYSTGKYWCLDIEGKYRASIFKRKINFGLTKKRRVLSRIIS